MQFGRFRRSASGRRGRWPPTQAARRAAPFDTPSSTHLEAENPSLQASNPIKNMPFSPVKLRNPWQKSSSPAAGVWRQRRRLLPGL